MKIKNLVLGIGIVILFGLALWQGIEAFHPSPKWEDFCQDRVAVPIPVEKEVQSNSTECIESGGKWINGYCDFYQECQKELENAQKEHSKIVFLVAIIVGFIALIVGFFILSIEPVGSALLGSGIWAIFWGSVINWRNFSDIWRFLLLLLVLILVIWLAVRLNSKKEKKSFLSRFR